MPRKRKPTDSSPHNRRPQPGAGGLRLTRIPVVPLVGFVAVALAFVIFYFSDAPPQTRAQRVAALIFLSAPDKLFLLWCGGKLSYFSLLDRWPIVLTAVTIIFTAWLAGRLFLRALGVTTLLTRLEQHVFAIATGLNLLSLYALAIGLAGGLQNRWLFVAPIIALLIANLALRRTAPPSAVPCPLSPDAANAASHNPRWLWLLLAALPFALVILLGAMLPPWDYDVREYHLQAPKEWYQNGRIDFLPHNIYADMPLGSELNSLWAMALIGGNDGWWWGALVGKTVMACYSLVSAAALIAFGCRLHSLAAGVVAAVIYLSAPWTAALATAGYNEGPVGLYAVLSIFALWLANQQQPSADKLRLIALAGICAGSAVACKYPPLLFLVFPLVIWVTSHSCFEFVWSLVIGHWSFKSRPTSGLRPVLLMSALFLLAAAFSSGLWFAKNWAQTNNPTYPLLYSLFDGRTRTPEKNAQWMHAHTPQPDENGWRYPPSNFLNQIAWNGWRTVWASLAIPPLIIMAVLDRARRQFIATIAAWIGFVFVVWWLTTHRLDRFLILTLPLAALLAALGALALPHSAWRLTTLAFIALTCVIHFPLVTLHADNRYFAPLDMLRRDDRELSLQGLRVETAHRWLNEHAQPGEKVLLLADAEPFDLELPAIYNTCFDDCQFTRIFKDRTREQRQALLREEKIAYVFCSWAHLARFRSPGNYGYTSDYPTPQLVHDELVRDQRLLIPIDLGTDPASGELFRVADK
jgi:hypothetical protein